MRIEHRPEPWRKTSQLLAPATPEPTPPGIYNVYPSFPLGPGHIERGFHALALRLAPETRLVIDGYVGVLWEDFREGLDAALRAMGRLPVWHDVEEALRPEAEIDRLIAPFLGGDDPLFGTRFTGALIDFFDPTALAALEPTNADIDILYGCGAALAGWDGRLIFLDVPKNEIQFRSRAGSVRNLGATSAEAPKPMYKRFYFVDWPALNAHKQHLLPDIDAIVDVQRPDDPTVMSGASLREGLHRMSRSYFRVRPWFEPGPWGGQWIKAHIPQLPQDAPNYAWSFELIVPENGLAFESDGHLLEVSFDMLMMQEAEAVLGASFPRFGIDFPIRFDFLDTVDGGNLSLQCHPRPDYIRRKFGEPFTQDETYYILDAAEEATVYLGFRDDIDPEAFRDALEAAQREATPLDVETFVQRHPARRHDLFLIPNGTIHCSGRGALVLEISATPYIFTFKMYDWMRLDLDGRPRPINIDRAFDNLYFDRKGETVGQTLLSSPRVVSETAGRCMVHLPTHEEHFYDVVRYEFDDDIEAHTDGSCRVMNLVEGTSVRLETESGAAASFNYAETFVVPSAAGRFRLVNQGEQPAKVVCAYIKKEAV